MTDKIPEGLKLDTNGTCQVRAFSYAVADNREAALVNFFDKNEQHFPLVFTPQLMNDLFKVAAASCAKMARATPKTGEPTPIAVIDMANVHPDLQFDFGLQYSPDRQVLRLTLGAIAMEFPAPREYVQHLAKSLSTEPEKRTLQ